MHDMVGHVGEQAARIKLTSVVARCKERRLAHSAGIAPQALRETQMASEEEVAESGKCYAELFLRAAEMSIFGVFGNKTGEDTVGVFASPVLEERVTEILLGFNEQGQVDSVLTVKPSA